MSAEFRQLFLREFETFHAVGSSLEIFDLIQDSRSHRVDERLHRVLGH
jgi:hypothetical protein